ncbi:FecR domain-containing protein [uncultured Cyclobacterium sp.]|uniref:FecR family protein n=1 Tax=uncultured Cyclobacterium sp. TaxID=453820 RepID=UPI0030EC70C4|tara:strand:+ start:406360 stop:407307 length:948 start_codon:yes stop_codon:yes gene_type:complete
MQLKQLIKWAKKYRSGKLGPERNEQFDSLLDELAHLGKSPSQSEINAAKSNVWKKIGSTGKSISSGRSVFLMVRKFAAVLLFFALVGLAVWEMYSQPTEIPMMVKRTEQGMRSTVTLSDGSRVRLNENSSLKFPETFSDELRMVYLNGEAFFDIMPNPDKPFKVLTGSSEITVLGTSFNVNTYRRPEITVTTGKVKVANLISKEGVELNPGQQATINTDQIQVSEVNPDFYIGWHTRKLEFEDEPIASVFSILERAYGVNIEVEMPEKEIKCVITGAYTGERIETILLGLRHILDFEYQTDISTKTIKIALKNCK